MPVTGTGSWTVIGDDGAVVAPVERYLAYLSALERSPNTVRAYAASLRLWLEFLGQAGVGWADAGVEDVARFVAWLRAPAGNVIVLETGTGRRAAATVNRHLAGVFGFYDHHARAGVGVAGELVAWRRVSRGAYKPFLHHVTKGRPVPARPVKLVVTRLPEAAVIPVSTPLVRLYSEYMHAEYGDRDCDYVFVNLFGGRTGQPLCYQTVQPPWTAVSVLPLGLRERNCADGRDGRSQRPMKPRNSVMSK